MNQWFGLSTAFFSLSAEAILLTMSTEKKLYIIRHGTTEMNEALGRQPWGSKSFRDQLLWDTVLTTGGRGQADKLNDRLRKMVLPEEIQVIVASPLTRTLQTADLVFNGFPTETPRIVCPLLRERLYLSSDVGVTRDVLKERHPVWDFSAILDNEPWWYTTNEAYVEWRPSGEYACPGEPAEEFRARLLALKTWIIQRPETNIALVTHWGVARGLTGESLYNCEMKIVSSRSLLLEPKIDH